MLYPIGIQDFEKLRTEGNVYVDKTALVYKMVSEGSYYFLSRPRRFGKSLLISTLEAYFKGKRELFKGLAIEKMEKAWVSHPVLHLDLNARQYDSPSALKAEFVKHLELWEKEYGSEYQDKKIEERFYHIVRLASDKTGQRVVILVDEYDKPMLQAIGNDELQAEYRSMLKAFYSVLKTQDRYIKFAFLTGVTKFGKVSVFSDLNNLDDLSMNPKYADICGISEKELHEYFSTSIHELADSTHMTDKECCTKLKEQFDGYHFSENSVGIYNPFSLLNSFRHLYIKDYWFETGTPTFLVEMLKMTDYRLERLLTEQQTSDMINSIDSMSKDPVPVIYQSGYLTIKDYDPEFDIYTLGFPNKEVKTGFIKYLLPFYTPQAEQKTEFYIKNFISEIRNGHPEAFLQRLQTLFANGDYSIQGDKELYFQNTMWAIFMVMGFYTEVEHKTSRGRIDLTIKTKDYIYVIECKMDGSAEEALKQIEEMQYTAPYAKDGRKVYRIGINFSSETRTVNEWKIMESNCTNAN